MLHHRKERRGFKAARIGIAIVLTVYLGLSIFGAVNGMQIPRLPLNDTPASVGLTYQDVAFDSRDDNLTLKGWYIPGRNNFVIIMVHGGYQNRVDENVDTLGLARDLFIEGYSLLLFDLRGRGESDGKGLTLSNIEPDIGGAVDYLKSTGYPVDNIGIIGFCSGAASTLIFASQEDVGAIVVDGCFTTIPGIVKAEAKLRGIPDILVDIFSPGVLITARLIYDYKMVNPIDVVADVKCPILFIYEELDESISVDDTYQLFEASSNGANDIFIVPGAEHSQSYKELRSAYVGKVASFFASNRK